MCPAGVDPGQGGRVLQHRRQVSVEASQQLAPSGRGRHPGRGAGRAGGDTHWSVSGPCLATSEKGQRGARSRRLERGLHGGGRPTEEWTGLTVGQDCGQGV